MELDESEAASLVSAAWPQKKSAKKPASAERQSGLFLEGAKGKNKSATNIQLFWIVIVPFWTGVPKGI